jgi:hypothetical protein
VAVPSLGDLWMLAKTVDRLLSSEKRNSESFAEVARRLDAIEARLTNLEAREERVRQMGAPALPAPIRRTKAQK